MIPDQWTLEGLEAVGFERCGTITNLQCTACAKVPDRPGVYVVFRKVDQGPKYVEVSPGGHFKGKDPTVGLPVLETNWVNGAGVVYIGKAGGSQSDSTLRKRLRQYMNFGKGSPVGHWGGRYIWQLADHGDLMILCRVTAAQEPSEYEAELLSSFAKAHSGKQPFANLTGKLG